MSIFSKLFGRKLPEDGDPNNPETLSGELVDDETDEMNPITDVVPKGNLAAKVTETFTNISALLGTINAELLAQREAGRAFQETTRAQVELMNNLGKKIENQNEAHSALVETLINLPKNLKRLPEDSEHQTQLLKEMNESIRSRGIEMDNAFGRVSDMLDEVPKTAEKQLESLDRMNERFEIVAGFNETLSKICEAAEKQAQSISVIEENAQASLKHVSEMRKATIRQSRQSAMLLGAILLLVLVFGSIGVWQILVR
jgi:archaellum component FlaC